MEKIYSKDRTVIAFDRRGAGPALILVGGAFQYRATDQGTALLAELLASQFSVYHYDRRGRGDSGDTLPYAVEREIEDIAALIDAAGGTALLFGMSSGAVLALDAANTLGSKVSKLAVYEPPFVVDAASPALTTDFTAQLESLLAAGRQGDAVELFMTAAIGMPAEQVASMRRAPFWKSLDAVAPTLAYDNAIMAGVAAGQPLPTDRWPGVTIPTLVVNGGASPADIYNGADALAALLPNAQRRILADQTHAVDPNVLAPVLLKFYNGSL